MSLLYPYFDSNDKLTFETINVSRFKEMVDYFFNKLVDETDVSFD